MTGFGPHGDAGEHQFTEPHPSLPARLDHWASQLRNARWDDGLTDDEAQDLSDLFTETANALHGAFRALTAVRDLHPPVRAGVGAGRRCMEDGMPWPCATVQAVMPHLPKETPQ